MKKNTINTNRIKKAELLNISPISSSIFSTIFFCFFISSCSVSKKIKPSFLSLKENNCNPPTYSTVSKDSIFNKNTDLVLANNSPLKNIFSEQSRLVLHALNLTDDVTFLVKNKKDTIISHKINQLEVRSRINTKILLALTDVSSLSAELDCEGERIDQIANYVDGINSNKNNKLVIGSILIGAAASVASGIIKNNNWNNGVSIGSGVLGGGLGLLTLNPKGKKIELFHKRNLLRDVWQETNINYDFPPFIWYMLTEKHFSNSGMNTLLESEKKRWIDYQFDGDESKASSSVIFSDGGIYRASDLHSRAEMLNQMQSVIRSINQQINYLLIEIEANLP